MSASSLHAAPVRKQLLRAWAISALFHVSTLALLGVAVQQVPRGGVEAPGEGIGIVLNRAGAEGDLNGGEEDSAHEIVVETPALPPNTLPELSREIAPTEFVEVNPQPAAPSAPTLAAGGQPNAGQGASGGGRQGTPYGDGDAQVSVFGVQGKGSKFVYLFDRSASMDGPPLAAAKRQLVESLQSLESVHQFHIIFFNTRTQSFDITAGGRRIAFATDRNKQLAARFVGGITADGGTDRLVALREAIKFTPDVIFFLTDADDPMTPSELAEVDRANRRAGTAICVIEFGRRQMPSPNNFLATMARDSGGQYGYVNTATLPK